MIAFDTFRTLAAAHNVVPVSRRILADTLTPVSAYRRLREGTGASFLFESVEGGERFARYSFIGRDPHLLIACRGKETTVSSNGSVRTTTGDFFDVLRGITSTFRQANAPSLPRFTGGLVGFIGYDAVRFIERVPEKAPGLPGIADSTLGLFRSLVVFDHLKHEVILIVNAFLDAGVPLREAYDGAAAGLDRLEEALFQPPPRHVPFAAGDRVAETPRGEFLENVAAAKEHIRNGDIFQVVLSQRFSAPIEGDPFNVYRALRVVNPSPYLSFHDLGGAAVLGSSPEILVRVEGGVAEVYPIAGTRPRGATDEDDRRLERELLADEKERAEHVMLIDLGRNDLGRVCTPGSVRVDQLMTVVRYSHVMHIASRVTGTIAPGRTAIDVLRAAFPAGTVSGAPKIRAMEIIDGLERSRRGLYAGGVGYFDFSGNMDFCIAIRTMYTAGGRVYLQAGAGIVADSDPGLEFEETINKAGALVESLRMAGEIVR